MEFKKFKSIGQFKDVIKEVTQLAKIRGTSLPTLRFGGSCKLHGTNAGFTADVKTGEVKFQSRTQFLEEGLDNAGFKHWATHNEDSMQGFIAETIMYFKATETLRVFGEWCGGNIQKGVALNQLPKMFVVFSIEVDGKEVDISDTAFNANGIVSIYALPTWEIEIDFNNPQDAQNKLVELTIMVEDECPAGKFFGVSGVGEGIVWLNFETGLRFKVKGEKHSVSRVKTLKELAPTEIAKIADTKEFIERVVTENRLHQGLEQLGIDRTDLSGLGSFIKWVAKDVFKEEMDAIIGNELNQKVIGAEIAKAARKFFLEV